VTRLANRKTRLTFATEDNVRYRGRLRCVVVEVDADGYGGAVRLEGTRARFPFSFAGLYNDAVKKQVEAALAVKRAAKKSAKAGRKTGC
jgi:uncharacterized protein (DUF952 family)